MLSYILLVIMLGNILHLRALQTDSSTKSRRKSIADGCKCAARGPEGGPEWAQPRPESGIPRGLRLNAWRQNTMVSIGFPISLWPNHWCIRNVLQKKVVDSIFSKMMKEKSPATAPGYAMIDVDLCNLLVSLLQSFTYCQIEVCQHRCY